MNAKQPIVEILRGDSQLTDMLAVNYNPIDATITPSKQNSINDVLYLERLAPMFITVQGADLSRFGQHALDAFFYIRCYNEKDKAFVAINEALERVKTLLDNQRFDITGYAVVEAVHELTRPELTDEAVGLPYREAQYRIRII